MKNITAGFLKRPEILQTLLHFDEGYIILKTLRCSPPYWERAKRDFFATIRQLGIPTFGLLLFQLLKQNGYICSVYKQNLEEYIPTSW